MKGKEDGFTLVEQVVALALSAIVVLGAAMTSAQTLRDTERNIDWTTSYRQAQNIGYWLSLDAAMVHSIDIGDDPGTGDVEFVSLAWKDWENGYTCYTSYVWIDAADSSKQLIRKQVVSDSEGVEIENREMLIATNIVTAGLSWQGDGWKLSVETSSGDRGVTREYEIGRRLHE